MAFNIWFSKVIWGKWLSLFSMTETTMKSIFANYPDIISGAFIPMIIAVFAIALPLLLQTISRVDDKYNSTKLIETFRKDTICYGYIAVLIAAIISYVLWILQIPRFVNCGILNAFVENSALIFVGITTIALIVMTFTIVHLIYVYYYPEKLLKYLIKKHDNASKNKKIYFEAISSILFYSIQKADEPLARQLLEFYFEVFIKYRIGKEKAVIEYPQEYYDSVFEANELLCMRNRRTVSYFNDSTLFELFLDSFQHTSISPKTYNFIWRCLLQVLHYNRDEFVISYWKKAHQLFDFVLAPAEKKYDDKFQIINQEEIATREIEREVFIEFHYSLGGLLMYLGKYELSKEIIYWTNQEPPKYVLVPERMEDVIKRYMDISKKGGYVNPVYYEQRYPFPRISGVNSDGIIQMWIKRYLSVLFLRQYTLHSYYTYSNPLNMPTPPDSFADMKRWNEELDSLNYFVKEYLKNKKILKAFGLKKLSDKKWFNKNQKERPSDLINKLRKKIDEKFEDKKHNQEIDPDILTKFKEKTNRILVKAFDSYSQLFCGNIESNYKSLFLGGRYQIMEKAGFAANQEVAYLNSDTVVAEGVALEFGNISLNALVLMQPKKYILKEEDIFKAIDKLNLNPSEHIIVAIGVNMSYFSMLNIQGLKLEGEDWFYNQMKIVNINNQMNDLVRQSFFILKKSDLPTTIYNEVSENIKEKFDLEKIEETRLIYANILDLNKSMNQSIKEEISNINTEDLSKMVIVCVGINTEIRYKTNTNCFQLKIFYQFDDRGTVNSLSDIQSVWDNAKE